MESINKELIEEKFKNLENSVATLTDKVSQMEKIYISIETLAMETKRLREDTNSIDNRLKSIEKEPGEKWKNITGYVLTAIVGAVVSYILIKLGVK